MQSLLKAFLVLLHKERLKFKLNKWFDIEMTISYIDRIINKDILHKFHCMSVQYDKYIYYNQHYAHDWSG